MNNQDIKLTVSLSPHAKAPFNTSKIMWMVVIALVPAIVASFVVFGPRALLVLGVSVACCLICEFLVETIFFTKRRQSRPLRGGNLGQNRPSILDGSAVITGLLLAMNLPASIPLWQLAIGAFFSIGVAKMVFGGLGQNPFNPALAGRAFMLASFPVSMTTFDKPFAWQQGLDAIAAPTALGHLKTSLANGVPLDKLVPDLPNWLDLFLGGRGGCIGEVSILAILIGGLFLLFTRVINWEIPVCFLGTMTLITTIGWLVSPTTLANPIFYLLAGGAWLGAFFMATDMVTSPMTFLGRVIFASGAGLITALIRLYGGYPEGTSYGILLMNALVPLIDRYLPPSRFGSKEARLALAKEAQA